MKLLLNLASGLLWVLCASGRPHGEHAPLNPMPHGAETRGGHIVVLNNNTVPAEVIEGLGLTNAVSMTYTTALKGFAGQFDDATLSRIRASPDVHYVDHDILASASVTQHFAEYNLAMISERNQLPYSNLTQYNYHSFPGAGITVYVLDTGVYTSNVDFGGRAHTLYSFYGPGDLNGHGTHVAGTVAGDTYGVAKSARVLSIKVLGDNGKGSISAIVGGIDIATSNCVGKCVINLSLGAPRSQALDQAASTAVSRDLVVVAAAGNENRDACAVSPAGAPGAITVAAVGHNYDRAPFSNFGPCVNIFAAGVEIASAGNAFPNAISVQSGTSQATPAVSGLIAYFLALGVSSGQREIFSTLLSNSKANFVFDARGSFNALANNGFFS